MSLSARELLRWGDLDATRRRQARRGPLAAPTSVWVLAAAALLFTELARRLGAFGGANGFTGASQTWLWIVAASHLYLCFIAPFRAYWRRDSALLARLPLPGSSLFRLSLYRALRASAWTALACGLGGLPLGIFHSWPLFGRHLVLLGLAVMGSGLLAPAVALAAGATVASDRAQALMDSFGGEFKAPKTTWLGALPGIAATGVALALIAGSSWATGGSPRAGAYAIMALGYAVPILLCLWALQRAPTVMSAAVREVAALDQERLAHVELSTPSVLERAWFTLTTNRRTRALAVKDACLLRRRYPSPYFLIPLGIAILWAVSAAAPPNMLGWGAAIVAVLGAYCALMASRATAPPTEHPQLLRSLPWSNRELTDTKRRHALLRLLTVALFGAAPLAIRSADPVTAAGVLAVVLLIATGASMLVASPHR